MPLPDPAALPRKRSRLAVVMWLILAAIIVFSLLPVFSVIVASTLANAFGCKLDEGSPHPCLMFGTDVGGTLYTLGVLGWLALVTLPGRVLMVLIWAAAAIIMRVMRGRRSSQGSV